MPTIGRYIRQGSPDSGYGEMAPDTARVTYMGSFSTATWITAVGARMGRNTGTNASAKTIFYDMAGPSSSPTTLFYASSAKTISAYMVDVAGGSNYEWSVTGLPIAAGRKLGGGIWADVASIAYGQDNSGAMMYFDASTAVVDPYNEDSSSPQGKISVWMTGTSNRAPNTPGIVSPRSGSTTIDPTPDITISFSDPDESLGDEFGKYRIELWNDANDTRLYTSGVVTTSSAQKTSGEATYTIPSTLAAGTYTVRAYTYDYFGVVSPARTWTFTVNSGGSTENLYMSPTYIDGESGGIPVTNNTGTSGSPIQFMVTWNHDSGLSTQAVAARLLDVDYNVVRARTEWSGTIADGAETGISIGATVLSGWAALARGATYRFQVQAQDTLGAWSPWTSVVFVVNEYPSVTLASTTPGDGAYTATYPTITATVTDIPNYPGSHTVTLSIADDGVTFADYTMLYRGGGVYSLALDSTHMPALDTYSWYITAEDAYGLTTTTSTRTLNYVAPPAVTITAPTGTITTGTPTVTATVDRTVSQYRVTITNDATAATTYDSGIITSGTISHAIPAATLYNEQDYTLALWVKTTDTLEVTEAGTFRVEYIPPAAMTNVAIDTVAASDFDLGDATMGQEPNVELAWDIVDDVAVPDAEWIGYLVTRTAPNGDSVQWTIADRYQPGMTDTTPAGGIEYTYSAQYQQVINTVDVVNSAPVELTTTVDLKHATITSENPDDPAVTLHFWEDRTVEQTIGVEETEILGQATLDTWHSALNYDRVSGTFTPIDDPSGNGYYTARQIVEAARTLGTPIVDENGKYQARPLFWRDPKGRSFAFRITQPVQEVDQHLTSRATFTLGGIEVAS